MGNAIVNDRANPEALDTESGANRTDLAELVDTSPYLQPDSDIVALMVLEHQSQMHNYMTLANMEARRALYQNQIMNDALGRSADHVSDSTTRRISSVAEKLVAYMLLVEEFKLASPVKGTSNFATEFVSRGPRDGRGRSLRDLDLHSRLFKYPCSYLVYSDAFDGLPSLVREQVISRLADVLGGRDQNDRFASLSATDRTAIKEILVDTKPEFRDAFR
jgi:hypothetical protein